ncbi:MAG: hypothetical protein H0W50_02995 [Parachlamydiaceae bacterium]|nr:hypothetical protein [Parachlamydiaceae bacterium]
MTSGAGIAGSSGQQDYRELVETTATKENAMKSLKMVADTLEICLLVFDDPQLLKYSSSSNRPVLSPLISTRVATNSEQPVDDSWKSSFGNLVNLMPQDFRELFQAVMQMPKAQQNRDFVKLNDSMQTEAHLLAFLAKAALPIESGSLADIRATENTLLPYIALKNFLSDSVVFFSQVQLFLEAVGPNYSNFDAISGYVSAFAPLVDDLRFGFEQLSDTATEKYGRYLLSDVGNKLDSLAESFDRLYGGNELLFLGNSLHAAALQAKALSLEQAGAAPLLISLTLANLGMESAKSDLGFFGKGLTALNDAFTSGVELVSLGKISSGSAALLNELATTAFTGMLIFGSLNYSSIAANDRQREASPEIRSENNFAYGLLLDMLTDSKGLSTLSSVLVNASGIEGSAKDSTQALLTPMLLFFLLSASVSGTDLTSTEPLVKSQSAAIEGGVQKTSTLLSNALSSGSLAGEDAANFNVYLTQASIALEQGNIGAFLGALNSSLELTGTTTDHLIADRKELNNVSQTLQNGVNTSASDQASYSTGVHVAA